MRRRHLFDLIQSLRQFFYQKNFVEALTPPMVENPGMETHIHPFRVKSIKRNADTDWYLHTSPEFCLKELLSDYQKENLENIYSISYCFRDEPNSPIHRSQFLMLEWYRVHARYEVIMQDIELLIQHVLRDTSLPARLEFQHCSLIKMTMNELWLETIQRSPLDFLNKEELKQLIKKDFPEVPVPETPLAWDDYFFLLFLNKIEPKLKNWPLLLIYEFPAPLAALSTLKASDPRVCERFEVYARGIELCNAYNELRDAEEQRRRFELQAKEKLELYGYKLPQPQRFLSCLERGFPASAGIALGVERLLYSLFEVEDPFFY